MSINSHTFHEGQLQWNFQQPPQWVTRMNAGQMLFWLFLSAAAFATLCQRVPQESTTAAQRAGRGHRRGTLTLLSLPPFLLPPPWAVTVLTVFALDKRMIVRLKVIRKCFLPTRSFYHHFSKCYLKKKISFLPTWPQAIKPARQLKIKTPKPCRFVRNTVLWPISQNILITVFNPLYNLLLNSDHENPCIAAKDFLDKSISGRMPRSESP